jgi:FkbM family methyltransferase
MIYKIVKLYSKIYGFAKDQFNINLPGLGFALRLIKNDYVINVMGRKMFFNHKVAPCYGRHISGLWNEPETHIFLNALISNLSHPVTFIDVGANIGEMVIDVSQHSNIEKIVAFEPSAECCIAIRKSLELNNFKNFDVIEKLVGETNELVKFGMSKSIGGSSVLSQDSQESDSETEMTTLDTVLTGAKGLNILLVDVEGYEPQVFKGGFEFIRKIKPLVIYEYNLVSKKHFKTADIQQLLGDEYKIFRLRKDGQLDSDVENTWNCVAIPNASEFAMVLNSGKSYSFH